MSERKKVFRKGVIPPADQMPAERTHARARLIYNVLKTIVVMGHVNKHKQEAALRELKDVNAILWDRVMHYYRSLTPEEIRFFIGPRPHYLPDGALAIYDPVKDNPLLMAVFNGEQPSDASEIWTPEKLQPRGLLHA